MTQHESNTNSDHTAATATAADEERSHPVATPSLANNNESSIVSGGHLPPPSPAFSYVDQGSSTAANNINNNNNTDAQTSSTSNDAKLDEDADELAMANEGLELLQVKGKGLCGVLERVPMGCKLFFLSLLLLVGAAFFGT